MYTIQEIRKALEKVSKPIDPLYRPWSTDVDPFINPAERISESFYQSFKDLVKDSNIHPK